MKAESNPQGSPGAPRSLPRAVGFLGSTAIVVGTIIGSGIFLVPHDVARQVGSVRTLMLVWILGGVLALGGALGTVAVIIKQELLLPFIGGIFVIEALSVMLQVGSYKLRKKRIFKMAPLHHHFELIGWSESKIIVRFWIVALVFALFSLTTLKLR